MDKSISAEQGHSNNYGSEHETEVETSNNVSQMINDAEKSESSNDEKDKLAREQVHDVEHSSTSRADAMNDIPDNNNDSSEVPVSSEEVPSSDMTKDDAHKEADKNSIDRPAHDPADDDNDGDPIPSGTGMVSKECSASELVGWSELLPKWHNKLNQRPRGLISLVRNGIPEPLRGEVWQLLSGAHQCSDLMDQYRIYLTQTSPSEQIILRDVHRTYPAHECFRSGAGSDSLVESLFKVCKAYSVYDEEVGYCQGLSFLVAALLLHMPEEQAFCVFVRIMRHYGLRDLFRNNFDELYLRFYQLDRLLEDQMPDLYHHFKSLNIEPFQYASQWFLTVFTAKFPLNAVFYIMDIFLLAGIETIFQIALALLSASKQELLASDFEGVLKFFRVQMPKWYRKQEHVEQLIMSASEISLKRLKVYTKNYEAMKKKEKMLEDPSNKRERIKLTEAIVRLENENDCLARDLIASKIQLRSQIDYLEDKTETLNRALTYSRQDCQSYLNTISDMEDERSRLEIEVSQLKEVCRRELQRAETKMEQNVEIIDEYKKICSQLSKRLENHKKFCQQFVEACRDLLRDNESCSKRTCLDIFQSRSSNFLERLKSDDIEDFESSRTECDTVASNEKQSFSQLETSSTSDHTKRPVGAYVTTDSQSTSSELKIRQLTEHINELEVELARTKLALVESECERQQLAHETPTKQHDKSTPASGLSTKFDFVRSAISSASSSTRSKEVQISGGPRTGGALTRINNLISEKISNISQGHQQAVQSPSTVTMSNSISTPVFPPGANGGNWLGGKLNSVTTTNNNRILDNNRPCAVDKNEHQC